MGAAVKREREEPLLYGGRIIDFFAALNRLVEKWEKKTGRYRKARPPPDLDTESQIRRRR